MLSGIPQVAQIGPSLVAKNGTPFCLFTRDLKNNYMPTIFLTVFAVLIVNLLPVFALAVLDHQFVF